MYYRQNTYLDKNSRAIAATSQILLLDHGRVGTPSLAKIGGLLIQQRLFRALAKGGVPVRRAWRQWFRSAGGGRLGRGAHWHNKGNPRCRALTRPTSALVRSCPRRPSRHRAVQAVAAVSLAGGGGRGSCACGHGSGEPATTPVDPSSALVPRVDPTSALVPRCSGTAWRPRGASGSPARRTDSPGRFRRQWFPPADGG